MQHLDEGTIHAWLDGALPADEAERVAAHVSGCAECGELVAEARGLIAASTRILLALDDVPGDVIPATAPSAAATVSTSEAPIDELAARRARRSPWLGGRGARAAAAAIAVVAVGTFALQRAGDRAGVRDATQLSAPSIASAERESADSSVAVATTPPPAPSAAPAETQAEQRFGLSRAPAAPQAGRSATVASADAPPKKAGALAEADERLSAESKAADAAAISAPTANAAVAPTAPPAPRPAENIASDLQDRSAKVAAQRKLESTDTVRGARTEIARRADAPSLDNVVVTGAASGAPVDARQRAGAEANVVRFAACYDLVVSERDATVGPDVDRFDDVPRHIALDSVAVSGDGRAATGTRYRVRALDGERRASAATAPVTWGPTSAGGIEVLWTFGDSQVSGTFIAAGSALEGGLSRIRAGDRDRTALPATLRRSECPR